jgi:superfamily II DNA or RNA helicase
MTAFISYRQQLRENALTQRQDGFHLHPYQQEAIEETWSAWQQGHHSVLVSLPTGTGKTEVALDLMHRILEQEPGGRALFLTHRRELVTQAAERLKIRMPQWANDVGIVMGGVSDAHLRERADKRVVIATVQSLMGQRRDRLALLRKIQTSGPFVFLTVDECHHAVARSYRDIAETLHANVPTLRHLGLTSTPVRQDEHDLSQVYHLAYYRSIRWAIENGYLVPPEGVRVGTDLDLSGVRRRRGDFVDEALGKALDTPAFNNMLVRLYQEFLSGQRTLVFCATVKHAQAVHAEFEKAGISTGLVVGTTSDEKRHAIIAAFVRGEMPVIVNVGVFTEGVDIPCAEGLIMARPTQSAVLYTQIVGRVLRLSPGKVKATIVDVAGSGQTLFTLDDMMESPSYRQAVRVSVAGHGYRKVEISDDPASANAQGPLCYWTEVVSLLGRSPTAWYSARGRSVAALNRQQYALLMPPGGSAVTAAIKSQLEKRPPSDAKWKARLQWQQEHTDDFCLFWIKDGICEPVDWDRDYNTLLSVASTWMESKVERSLSARERRWRHAQASDRQADSLARWGVIPSVEWLHAREREVGIRFLSGTASDLLSYKIALSAYSIAGFVLPPTTERNGENAESRFRRLLREQPSYRNSRRPPNH